MQILNQINQFMEDLGGWSRLLFGIMTVIGLWKLFRKSDIPGWWAFIPFARDYKLAQCAGREEAGRVMIISSFLVFVLNTLSNFLEDDITLVMVMVLLIVCIIILIIYRIQVYMGMIELYGTRKLWIILWALEPSIPELIWGLMNRYQPAWTVPDFHDSAVSHVKGADVEDIGEGLTVNLKERSVIDFFHKKVLLRDMHLNIKPGRLVMLLGGSGAGKTTFLNAVNGYEKADAKVMLNGRDVYKEYRKMLYEVGFVPQSDLIRGKDTVYYTLLDTANLRLPLSFTNQDRRDRVEEALKLFGLTPARNTHVEILSGGQRKRLSIAMEFLSNHYLFILDEPDSGLDGVMARELFVNLRKIADTGRIVIVITHTPDRVIDLFDDVIILAKDSSRVGRLAFYGPVEDCRKFFGRERMEEIVKCINRPEEGGEGRADEFILKYAEVQHV